MPHSDASWSITPHGTPDATSSAWRSSSASAGRSALPSSSAPRARATATSRAADDERPVPTGMVVVTVPVNPVRSPVATATAAT